MKAILWPFLIMYLSLGYAQTSSENRSDKKLELLFQTGYDYTLSASQFSAGYYLKSDDIIGFKIGSGRDNDEHQTSAGIFYKHYEGNSFYITGGLSYLNTYEDRDWNFLDHSIDQYTSLGADIRIGNQWSWKYFTLGCDWVGVGSRLIKFKKEDDDDSNGTFTLLNLNIGSSF